MKQINILLGCIFFAIITTGYGQIVNEGSLQISPLTLVYFGDEYTNKSAGSHNNNGDLYLNSNFINNGSTASASGTTFFKSNVNAIQELKGNTKNVNFYNLEIDNTLSGVLVENLFGVIVTNGVSLRSGTFRLDGESQLVQSHSGTTSNTVVSGKLAKDKQGNSLAYAYNHVSSPVSNAGSFTLNGGMFDGSDASLNPFTPQQVLFNSGSPYNGLPSVLDGGGNVLTPLTLNTYWMYKFSRGGVGSYADWIKIDQNSTLNPGEGFIMKGTNTAAPKQNYVFVGVPNDGEYTFPISAGESSLLGNPYPSAIDAVKFINDNLTLFGELFFWVDGGSTNHNLSDYLGGYAIRNLSGGVAPSVPSAIRGIGVANTFPLPQDYIAVGQGFFVEAGSNGTIVFDNSQRAFKTESSGESVSYKTSNINSEKAVSDSKSMIRIGYEDPEGFHRQLALSFMPYSPATLQYNRGYDALIPGAREDELFFIIDNDLTKQYVIQGVGAFNELQEFPLGLTINEIGIHTIMLDGVENFSGPIYIKDKILNLTYNITESSFSPNLAPGNYLDRYVLVFKTQEALNVSDYLKENIRVSFKKDFGILINNRNNIQINSVSVYNNLGQLIKNYSQKTNNTEIVLPFNSSSGIYFVNLETDKGINCFKISNL